MRKCKYEEFTIERIEYMVSSGYITEMICDGDNKTIEIPEKEYLEIEKVMQQIYEEKLKPVINAFVDVFKTICEAVQPVINSVCNFSKAIMNKKISKKKFMKLLQSSGIQRNEINKIVKNNKEKYTYLRYYTIVNNLEKNQQKK